MSEPLPRGTRKPYKFLLREALRWEPKMLPEEAFETAVRALEFVKAMETARVRARRRKS